MANRFTRGAQRVESMSVVMWKVIRRLPKPLLLLLSFFPFVALCRA